MSQRRVLSISFLVVVLFLPLIALGQEQGSMPERNSIDWFYQDANYHTKPLLMKLLSFTAPYPGYYQETVLDANGNAFTARNVPNWAMQGSSHAKLDDALLAQIKKMLAQLNFAPTQTIPQPEYNRLHNAFIYFDGRDFVRLNYNGTNPPQIDAILDILKKEFKAAERAREDEIAAHQKLMREKYGDWQSRPGVTVITSGSMHGCKGNSALVVSMLGQRQTAATSSPVTVSVYHALIFYPPAAVTSSGSRGRRNDPVQSYEVIWRVPSATGSFTQNTSEQKFEIQHHAIDATVTIGGKTYELTAGNMFVIRIGADWVPAVTQLNDLFEEQATAKSSLDRFKTLFKNDASIQQLELY
jgi:hypothetical protein